MCALSGQRPAGSPEAGVWLSGPVDRARLSPSSLPLCGSSSRFRTRLCFIVWVSCGLLLSARTDGRVDGWTDGRGPWALVACTAVGIWRPF